MRKELVITMSLRDRKKYENALKQIHDYLMEQGYKLEEGDERLAMWGKTRMLKEVIGVFSEE